MPDSPYDPYNANTTYGSYAPRERPAEVPRSYDRQAGAYERYAARREERGSERGYERYERGRRAPRDGEVRPPSRPDGSGKGGAGWQLVLVQSLSCIAVLLIAGAFRLIGGSAFQELRTSFQQSLQNNSILATFAALLERDESGQDASVVSGDSSGGDGGENALSAEDLSSSDESAEKGESSAANAESTDSSAPTGTSSPAAAGGNDLPGKKQLVFYPPEGATFAPLRLNRLAYKPLGTGTVTSGFGYRTDPLTGEESFHQGLDIAADTGSPIFAMYFGVVRAVGSGGSYGSYIRLYHGNGLEVLYAHCSEILVQEGAVVRAGEVVARVGSTGNSTGAHLHVETLVNGLAYDPAGVVPTQAYA